METADGPREVKDMCPITQLVAGVLFLAGEIRYPL